MEALNPTSESRPAPPSQPRLLGTRRAKQPAARPRLLSPALRVVLGIATAVTLGFAVFSAVALHAEPALRVEHDEPSVQPRPAAPAPAPERPAATSPSARRPDAGATRSADYLPRARALDRGL